jgi:hypothetical protein
MTNTFLVSLGQSFTYGNNSLFYILNLLYYIDFLNNNNQVYSNLIEYIEKINNDYNIKLELINEDKFNIIIDNYIKIQNLNCLDLIINTFLKNKELKHIIKNFINNYYLDRTIINLMLNELFNNNLFIPNRVLNLFSGSGGFSDWLFTNKKMIHHNNIYSCDTNNIINLINIMNKRISFNINIEANIINGDIIHDNLFNMNYDLVICDIPDNIKNITHASCCDIIKNLKIRGTKSEPLILQLLSQLVSKNGFIVCYVSDSLLFNDSKQHIDTRKYLINKFNNIKVISSENKKSILILHNSPNNKIIELNNKEVIINSNYSLYYQHYEDNNKEIINGIKLMDLVDIKKNIINDDVLYISKFNNLSIGSFNPDKHNFAIVTKNNDLFLQKFINIYVKKIIINNLNKIIKGKMKQIDETLLLNIEIDNYSIDIQKNIICYEELNKNIIKMNNDQINNINNLKKIIINKHIINHKNELLCNICSITHEAEKENIIYIHKNSNSAGLVGLTNEPIKTTNIFFININNPLYEYKYIYYILKFNQEYLVKISNENNTIGLSLNKLENLLIPILTNVEQINLINILETFDIEINQLISSNKKIENSDFKFF